MLSNTRGDVLAESSSKMVDLDGVGRSGGMYDIDSFVEEC
jgi:hypothetical protein